MKKSDRTPDAKLVPFNAEAEEAVLGSIFVDPDNLGIVQSILTPADFYREKNAWVYEAMLKVAMPDQITVAQELLVMGRLEAIGGAGYLSLLVERLPTSLHCEHYANIVADLACLRRLIGAAGMIAAIGYECAGTTQESLQKAQDCLARVQPRQKADLVDPAQHAERMLTYSNRERKAEQTISFGYANLDRWTGGMHSGNLVIVGARPGMGKSQLMQEVATFNVDRSKVVLIASAEMSLEEWDERQIAMEAGVSLLAQKVREPSEKEMERIQTLVSRTASRSLYFLQGHLTESNIERQARFLKDTKGLDLIVVDYIQLLADTVSGDSVREKVGYISRSLKRLARDCECPVMVASQLNRNLEARTDKRPILADLKETGDLEQDSDLVLLLHRPEAYKPDDEPGMAHIYIAKMRQGGKVGKIELRWDESSSRYRDPFDVPLPRFEEG